MRFAFATITLAAAQQPCENLKTLTLPNVTITLAASVPAGPFALPTAGNRSVNVPAFCRVAGVVAPEVKFELWMPAQWNKKFVAVGNGGLAGSISFAAMVAPLQQGYAASSTDTGHSAGTNDGSWALGHFERSGRFRRSRDSRDGAKPIKRFCVRSTAHSPVHAYFTGCSQGGHEALIEAQRYPTDFDGIVAGDPANFWTHHYIGGHLWAALAMEGDGYIPAAKIPAIADAVNDACDALDGVKDGVLNDPRRCHFDPSVLLCKGSDNSTCLTAAQVDAVKKLYAGYRNADGDQIYPGLVPGGEAGPGGWANWITGRLRHRRSRRPGLAVLQVHGVRQSRLGFPHLQIRGS